MSRKVWVDKDNCTSCEACASELPSVFRMDDEGLAEVHNSAGASEEEIQTEIDGCPGECIHWVDENKPPDGMVLPEDN